MHARPTRWDCEAMRQSQIWHRDMVYPSHTALALSMHADYTRQSSEPIYACQYAQRNHALMHDIQPWCYACASSLSGKCRKLWLRAGISHMALRPTDGLLSCIYLSISSYSLACACMPILPSKSATLRGRVNLQHRDHGLTSRQYPCALLSSDNTIWHLYVQRWSRCFGVSVF